MRSHTAVLGCLLSISTVAWAEWVVIPVPHSPEWSGISELTDINDAGEACGMGDYVVNQTSTAIRFDGHTVTELPHLLPNDPVTLATGINNAGIICGYSRNSVGNSQAVYYEGVTLHPLPDPNGANPDADFRAYDINDNNVIVGYFWSQTGQRTAFYYHGGVSYSLNAVIRDAGLMGLQIANAINNKNIICGSASDAMGNQTGWTYDIDTQAFTVIGKAGLGSTSARHINDLGQIVGRAKLYPWDPYQAVVFSESWAVIDPSVTETQWGIQINDHGRMIGHADTSADRWGWYADTSSTGSMIELVLPGWNELTLGGVNGHDWMVGCADHTNSGAQHGLIIKPPPGDYDHDGYLNVADAEAFAQCMTGPGNAVTSTTNRCLNAFDVDWFDGAIDLHDFQVFAIQFEGD